MAARSARDANHTLGALLFRRGEPLALESEWVALVRAAAAGEQTALVALYDRASKIVFTLAFRITRDRHTAEEVTLDVFHEVWERARDYDPANGTVLGWMANIARSRSIDRVRFDRRKKRLPDGEPALDRPADFEHERHALMSGLDTLRAPEREVLEAIFVRGLTHVEAAAALGQPLGTVKTRIRTALAKLKDALKGDER